MPESESLRLSRRQFGEEVIGHSYASHFFHRAWSEQRQRGDARRLRRIKGGEERERWRGLGLEVVLCKFLHKTMLKHSGGASICSQALNSHVRCNREELRKVQDKSQRLIVARKRDSKVQECVSMFI